MVRNDRRTWQNFFVFFHQIGKKKRSGPTNLRCLLQICIQESGEIELARVGIDREQIAGARSYQLVLDRAVLSQVGISRAHTQHRIGQAAELLAHAHLIHCPLECGHVVVQVIQPDKHVRQVLHRVGLVRIVGDHAHIERVPELSVQFTRVEHGQQATGSVQAEHVLVGAIGEHEHGLIVLRRLVQVGGDHLADDGVDWRVLVDSELVVTCLEARCVIVQIEYVHSDRHASDVYAVVGAQAELVSSLELVVERLRGLDLIEEARELHDSKVVAVAAAVEFHTHLRVVEAVGQVEVGDLHESAGQVVRKRLGVLLDGVGERR